MIAIAELVSAEALRRYDDTGEPAYSTYERVLLAMRWFDWAPSATIIEAIGADIDNRFERERYERALQYWHKHGRVERRPRPNDWPAVYDYRLLPPTLWVDVECKRHGCHEPRVKGAVRCERHLEWQRENKRARRAA